MENKTVTMAHGAGGKQTSELIDQVFKAHFANSDRQQMMRQCWFRRQEEWLYLPMDLSYRQHFSRVEISENCLSAVRSMTLHAWEQNHCT